MRTHRSLFALPLVALSLGLGACGDDDEGSAEPAGPEPSPAAEVSIQSPDPAPLVGGFYDGGKVNYLLTDVSVEEEAEGLSEATGYPVAFVPSLGEVPDSSTAKLYLFMNGVEGPNPFGFQANVLDSVSGEDGYSPLWRVHAVTWEDESKATELRSEEDILDADNAGEVTIEETPLVKNSPVVDGAKQPPFIGGFYEGQDVSYLLTDVSVEEEAKGLSDATGYPVTFVPSLGEVPDGSTAKLYLFMNGVEGPNPFGFQANVVDSIPGEDAYSPLWRVHAVSWENESDARELRSEAEILDAEAAGEVTIEETPLVKNSPVVVDAS